MTLARKEFLRALNLIEDDIDRARAAYQLSLPQYKERLQSAFLSLQTLIAEENK